MELISYIQNLHTMLEITENPVYVLGNTSADYDSIIGSIIYAFILTSIMNVQHIPIIDCKIQDLALRFEVSYVLEKLGIKASSLVFFNEISWNEQTQFILYDHNSRQEQMNILQIVDHHDMLQINPQKHLIYPAGSGLTLLWFLLNRDKLTLIENTEQLFQQLSIKNIEPFSEKLRQFLGLDVTIEAFERPLKKYDILVDQLLRYGILLDSVGFADKNRQRWMLYDRFAVEQIQRQRRQIGQQFAIGYKELDQIKFDQKLSQKLSLQDHLRKDYKLYFHELTTITESYIPFWTLQNKQSTLSFYSIVYMDPRTFLQRYNSDGQLQKLLKIKIQQHQHNHRINLTSYTILFSYKQSNQPKKDILIYCDNTTFKEKMITVLEKISIKKMNKQSDIKILSSKKWTLLSDQDGIVSRKKITKAMIREL